MGRPHDTGIRALRCITLVIVLVFSKTALGGETVCENLPPLASGTCEVFLGDNRTLIIGTVLAPGHIYRGGRVLVDEQGTITCVGCNCSAPGAAVVRCPQGAVSPGLINPHDHIRFAQNDPRVDTGERYEHRHEWRRGLNGHTQIPASGGATIWEKTWGELRHLFAGTTSLVGAGGEGGLVRNLDMAANLEQPLSQFEALADTFPLGDVGGQLLTSGCGYPDIVTAGEIASEDAFLAHVAEGIDSAAQNEFACLSSFDGGGQDLVEPQSAFVHLVGLTASDYALLSPDATELVWSPRSNISLYGDTARVTSAAKRGVTVALGTDWVVSGSMNLLRELRCADSLNQIYLDGFFADVDLWRMVTGNAAIATGTDSVIGTLETGKVADIAIFDASSHADYRSVIEAAPEDLTLVLRGGLPVYGDATVVLALRPGGLCDALDVCGTEKVVCLVDETGIDLPALQLEVAGIYPAFFCGEPDDEPTCTPMRPVSVDGSSVYTGIPSPVDPDGDGIEEYDNCPTVFNPIRPLDAGTQADSDGNGIGDACEPAPSAIPALTSGGLLFLALLLPCISFMILHRE